MENTFDSETFEAESQIKNERKPSSKFGWMKDWVKD
jgi:hypothetical protein